jgi:lipopolysaccharide transport protein LptA
MKIFPITVSSSYIVRVKFFLPVLIALLFLSTLFLFPITVHAADKSKTAKAAPAKAPVKPAAPNANKPAEKVTEKKRSPFREALSNGSDAAEKNVPTTITSDELSLDAKTHIFTYRKNVEVIKGDVHITADVMVGKYNDKNELQVITCDDNVVITRGDTLRATSNKGVYDVPKGTVVLTESPELNDKGNILNADVVTVYVDEDKSEAEGHVRVKVVKSTDLTVKSTPTPVAK